MRHIPVLYLPSPLSEWSLHAPTHLPACPPKSTALTLFGQLSSLQIILPHLASPDLL